MVIEIGAKVNKLREEIVEEVEGEEAGIIVKQLQKGMADSDLDVLRYVKLFL